MGFYAYTYMELYRYRGRFQIVFVRLPTLFYNVRIGRERLFSRQGACS